MSNPSAYCIFRGNLVEHFEKAMALYTTTVEATKRLHGKDFYEAQLRVVDAHVGFERARQDILDQRQLVH
jgi:hypothetical protein